MLILLWSMLNVLLLLAYAYVAWKVLRLLQQKIGWGPAMIFALGFLSTTCASHNTAAPQNKNLLATPKTLASKAARKQVPLGYGSSLSILVEGNRQQQQFVPQGLFASPNGFLAGHTWEPQGGFALARPTGSEYSVFMLHRWQLLGTTLWYTHEEYSGFVAVP